jgi:tRNA modification GTPase
MRNADLVLYLFDATTETNTTLAEVVNELKQTAKQWLLVGNKVDEQQMLESKLVYFGVNDALYISAKEGKGLNAVRAALVEKVTHGAINTEQTIVTNARHYQALEKVALSIVAIQRGIDQQLPGDLLAIDIRQCLHYLGEITGQISNEDQLDFIFSKFCIGK